MRRFAFPIAVLVALVAIVLLARGGSDAGRYRVAAVFDTAQGIVPGQLVKIAGARVGEVEDGTVTPDNKARFLLDIDGRFGPFHDDASCKILPEGFIAESFIQCEPGTPGRPDLGGDGRPTVPLERTEASVQLQDVLDTFPLPVDQRIRAMLSEMGIAAAGRGDDLNALLRRANPALQQTRRMLAVLGDQQAALDRAVGQTDAVLAELGRREGDLRGFIGRAAETAEATSAERAAMERSIQRLPALLRQADASLASLERVSARLTPTAEALRASAPQLTRLNRIAAPLAKQAMPALRGFEPAVGSLRKAATPATNVVHQLRRTSERSALGARESRRLLEETRRAGGLEMVQDIFYALAAATATYDKTGHAASINVNLDLRCILDNLAPGCSAKFNAPGKGKIPSNDPSLPSQARVRRVQREGTVANALPERTARELETVLDRLLGKR